MEDKNIYISKSIKTKYYEYKDGLVSFKTKTYSKEVKIKEIISEEHE